MVFSEMWLTEVFVFDTCGTISEHGTGRPTGRQFGPLHLSYQHECEKKCSMSQMFPLLL